MKLAAINGPLFRRPRAQSCNKVQAVAISCKIGQFLSGSARPGRTRTAGPRHHIYDSLVVMRDSESQFSGKVFGAEPNFAQKFGAEPKIPCSCGSSNHRLWQKYRKRLPISPQTRSWLHPANHALMAIESYFLADVLVAATNFVQ